jgi:hypothetical protein
LFDQLRQKNVVRTNNFYNVQRESFPPMHHSFISEPS